MSNILFTYFNSQHLNLLVVCKGDHKRGRDDEVRNLKMLLRIVAQSECVHNHHLLMV